MIRKPEQFEMIETLGMKKKLKEKEKKKPTPNSSKRFWAKGNENLFQFFPPILETFFNENLSEFYSMKFFFDLFKNFFSLKFFSHLF